MFTKKLLVITIGAAFLATGCATSRVDPNYAARLQAQASIDQVRAQAELEQAKAETARMVALQKIGESGDTQARQFAVFALAVAGTNGKNTSSHQSAPLPPPPESTSETVLKWAQVISGPVAVLGSGYFGYKLGVAQSNNQAATTIAGYNTFGTIANAGFTSNNTIAGHIQAPQPNITLSGTGVIGSGSFTPTTTTTTTTNTNSFNRNCTGGAAGTGTTGTFGAGSATC